MHDLKWNILIIFAAKIVNKNFFIQCSFKQVWIFFFRENKTRTKTVRQNDSLLLKMCNFDDFSSENDKYLGVIEVSLILTLHSKGILTIFTDENRYPI